MGYSQQGCKTDTTQQLDGNERKKDAVARHVPHSPFWREPARGGPPGAEAMRVRGLTGKGQSGRKGASLHLPQTQSLPAVPHCAFRFRF